MARVARHLGFDFRNLRALVVEDNETNQLIIVRMMRNMGCAVVEHASNGDEALTVMLTSSHGYDLVISDFEMPIMNGLQLLKRIRVGAPGVNRDIAFVMLTGHTDRSVVGTAFNLDVDSFVVKPVTPKGLQARISHVMSTDRLIKRPVDYGEMTVDGMPMPTRGAAQLRSSEQPPWEVEEARQKAASQRPKSAAGGGAPSAAPRSAAPEGEERELSRIVPGSSLAEPVYSGTGHMLLPTGHVLDQRTIERLRNLSEIDDTVTTVYVHERASGG